MSKKVIPASSASWMHASACAASWNIPKLLQPRPTADTRIPVRPSSRCSIVRTLPRSHIAASPPTVQRNCTEVNFRLSIVAVAGRTGTSSMSSLVRLDQLTSLTKKWLVDHLSHVSESPTFTRRRGLEHAARPGNTFRVGVKVGAHHTHLIRVDACLGGEPRPERVGRFVSEALHV